LAPFLICGQKVAGGSLSQGSNRTLDKLLYSIVLTSKYFGKTATLPSEPQGLNLPEALMPVEGGFSALQKFSTDYSIRLFLKKVKQYVIVQ